MITEIMSISSKWVRLGASSKRAPFERCSSPVDQVSLPSKEFESPLVVLTINLSLEFPCVELEMRLFKRQKLGFMLKSP